MKSMLMVSPSAASATTDSAVQTFAQIFITFSIGNSYIYKQERIIRKVILYHGSNVAVAKPEIVSGSGRGLDFGCGFYTTSNYEQAARFTSNVVRRQRGGERTVSSYEITDDAAFDVCSVRRFDKPDEAWLDFVALNRSNRYNGEKYDLVIGPVANDTVYNVINLYLNGTYTKAETLWRLKVRKLFDQWTFCTGRSIKLLKYIGSEVL